MLHKCEFSSRVQAIAKSICNATGAADEHSAMCLNLGVLFRADFGGDERSSDASVRILAHAAVLLTH